MNWENESYLLFKRKFRENGSIINVFTPHQGKVSGIVYGGNSRKIKNYLQISNKIYVINNSKNENKIGYFKTELIKAISPKYFNDKKKTSALIATCSILNILLPEGQPNPNIYKSFENLLNSLNLENWIIILIYFEISLIKNLGYDTNLSMFNNENNDLNISQKIKIDDYIYEVPNYLIKKKIPENLSNNLIKKSMIFTRSIMIKKFFLPNNLVFPKARILLENYFN